MGKLNPWQLVTRVIGIDPGGTTGIAYYDIPEKTFVWEQTSASDAPHYIEAAIVGAHSVAIGIERYVTGAETIKHSRQHDPEEIIGIVKNLERKYAHVQGVFLQGASEAKRQGTRAHLLHMGCYPTGQPHARDALGHVLVALVKVRPSEVNRLLKGCRI